MHLAIYNCLITFIVLNNCKEMSANTEMAENINLSAAWSWWIDLYIAQFLLLG